MFAEQINVPQVLLQRARLLCVIGQPC